MRFYGSEEGYHDQLWFVGKLKGQGWDGQGQNDVIMWIGDYCYICGDYWIHPSAQSFRACQVCRRNSNVAK